MVYDDELMKWFCCFIKLKLVIIEKKMMGGMCFLFNGNMIGGVDCMKDGQGWLMFCVGKDNVDVVVKLKGGEEMI